MKEIILKKLGEIEEANSVSILFACESGSRAWGFHSPDSDFDVRFVYVHKREWYTSIEERQDFIELPVNEVLDINGWDIKKALKLFRSSNSVIYEWLQSPILYKENGRFAKDLFSLKNEYYSLRSGMHHYLSMTNNCFQNELIGEQFKLKKYFYALRPILAALWIAKKKECPPMEFGELRKLIDNSIIDEKIDALLKQKSEITEKFEIVQDQLLHEFIKENIEYCEQVSKSLTPKKTSVDSLNQLFRTTIGL